MENNEDFMPNSPTISDCCFYWHGYPNFHPTLRLLKRQKMIKANDLRIGNYILSLDNQGGSVISLAKEGVGIKISDLLFSYEFYEKVNPIPLTKEWLLKFGFKFSGIVQQKEYIRLIYEDGGKLFFYSHAMSKIEVRHVHQLQNLYFSLTGEELTLTDS